MSDKDGWGMAEGLNYWARKRITRRAALQRAALAGGGIAALGLAACGGSSKKKSSSSASSGGSGGTLTTVAKAAPSGSPDPQIDYTLQEWQLRILTHDGLVGFKRAAGTEGTKIVADLATAVPKPTDGGKTFTDHQIYDAPSTVSYNHNFTNVSVDKAGNVYAVYSDNHYVYMSYSTNHGRTWHGPYRVSKTPANTAIYPWSPAGSGGRLAIVYYGIKEGRAAWGGGG